MKPETLTLRCYCCGEPIPTNSQFALVAQGGEGLDRVFVMLPEHTDRVDDGTKVLLVKPFPEVR